MILRLIPVLAITLLITGCDVASVLGPDPRTAQREADGRAIGGACRHAMRGIEDCYKLNERAPKTAKTRSTESRQRSRQTPAKSC